MDQALDELVRSVDHDRWLAARFAEPPARERLVAVYALTHEVAKTAEAVSEAAVGAIRLQFWRDAVAAIFEGAEPPNHPAAAAFARAHAEAPFERAVVEALIDARGSDFQEVPFEEWSDLEAYVDATAGGVMRLAAQACAPGVTLDAEQLAALTNAARAWGYLGLVRALRYWQMERRTFFPRKLMQHLQLTPATLFSGKMSHAPSAAARTVLDRSLSSLQDAQRSDRSLPAAAFPALAYVTLIPHYHKLMIRDGILVNAEPKALGAITRRLALVAATARGRL